MTASPEPKPRYCLDCGAEVRPDAILCWCCRHSLLESEAEYALAAKELHGGGSPFGPEPRTKFQFSLASILIVMTLVAVLCSIYTMAPGLGIALMVLSVPALIRTVVLAMQRGSRGKPLTFGQKAGVFAAWIGLSVVIVIAAGVAFFVSCLVGLPTGKLEIAFTLGGIGAIVAAILLGVLFWRKIKF
jgi:hypothetical protein